MMKKKIIWLVLAVVWAGVIFSFSAKNADESSKESRKIGKFICSDKVNFCVFCNIYFNA